MTPHGQRAQIQDFLNNWMTQPNRKVESVRQDNLDERIDRILTTIGLLFFKLTGPNTITG